MAGSLILVANPGSASRKYALYENERCRGELHFEWLKGHVICTVTRGDQHKTTSLKNDDLTVAIEHVLPLLQQHSILHDHEKISCIGLRVVAPGAYFLQHHVVNEEFVHRLEAAVPHAPLHALSTLRELTVLKKQFDVPIIGVSDSAFHITKPEYAWNYGISLKDADKFDVKRFGYHGLSAKSVIQSLSTIEHLGRKTVVCHIGSGVSVTAVKDDKSFDTTMGYSPLDGTIMATRSGSIDWTAGQVLKRSLQFNDAEFETYLNTQSGLQGLGESSDIRELLQREASGDSHARLALSTYVYSIRKAIGQMLAVLDGVDQFTFTGTVGERSSIIRARILDEFTYVNLGIDRRANDACIAPANVTSISLPHHPIPVFVVPANEAQVIARETLQKIMTQ